MVNEKGDVKGYLRVAVQALVGGEEESEKCPCFLVFFYFFNGADVDRGGGRKGGRAADPPCVG